MASVTIGSIIKLHVPHEGHLYARVNSTANRGGINEAVGVTLLRKPEDKTGPSHAIVRHSYRVLDECGA